MIQIIHFSITNKAFCSYFLITMILFYNKRFSSLRLPLVLTLFININLLRMDIYVGGARICQGLFYIIPFIFSYIYSIIVNNNNCLLRKGSQNGLIRCNSNWLYGGSFNFTCIYCSLFNERFGLIFFSEN